MKFLNGLGRSPAKFGRSWCVPSWQPTQYLSRTGWTSRAKENPRTGPRHGVISEGRRLRAVASAVDGEVSCVSWQPTHETLSPAMAVNQLRMI